MNSFEFVIDKTRTIRIGDQITLKVMKTDGNRVRIAIDAPRDIRINREEVMNKTRSVTEIERVQNSPVGCCEVYANYSGCTCLSNAIQREIVEKCKAANIQDPAK